MLYRGSITIKGRTRRIVMMQLKPTVRKIPADSVPYGRDICTRGSHVWAAYSDPVLVCIAATRKEVRCTNV